MASPPKPKARTFVRHDRPFERPRIATTEGSAPGGVERDERPPAVALVVDENVQRALALASRLHALALATIVHQPASPAQEPLERVVSDRDVDIALLQLGAAGSGAIANAQSIIARDAATDVMFFYETECAELTIARGLGISRIILADALPEWLSENAPLVVNLVRARRALFAAQQRLPALPPLVPPGWGAVPALVPLPVAEQRFREAFLRQLLTDVPNRDAAARIAGIPYRTLCDMLQKLGMTAVSRSRRGGQNDRSFE